MELVYDVVIIGGGVTGLSAAETLAKSNQVGSIGLLEAQGRFGGRTCTVKSKLEEDTVDIGGQWVGPSQSKVLSLLDKYGIEKIEQTFSPELILPTGEKRPRYVEMIHANLIPLPDEDQLEILNFEKHLEELCKKIDLEKPWMIENAIELDRITVAEYIETNVKSSNAKYELLLFCQGMVSSDPKDCSFLFFIFFVASGGGVVSLGDGPDGMQKWKLRGGAQQISEFYAEDVKKLGVSVHLSSPVTSIVKEVDRLKIICSSMDSKVVYCKKIIIAMSPALSLKKISFDESILTPEKKALYSSMKPGRVVKIILSYREEFWHVNNLGRHPISVDDLSTFFVHNIFPSSVGQYPALVGLLTGSAADKYTEISLTAGIEAARAEVYKQLALMYGCRMEVVSSPVEIFEKNWCLEEFAFGCFAGFYPPLALTSYGPHMRTSSNGVYWASTETTKEFYAYMEGGLRAGEDVAKLLLSEY